ncbi:MAG: FHA domain-containing protein, partial [Roseburia sp.]|nr:FHA domain-containing protein [Roseburia sp.]
KKRHGSVIERLQKWFRNKKKEITDSLPGKKKREEDVFVFEPEEAEEVRESRPIVLLSEISQVPQGILKYEGEGSCPDLKVEDTPYIIGSDGNCDGVIKSGIVSRRHAKITKTEDVYFIEDLNSSNGTYVGGELLNCRVKMSLQRNETILFGNEKFRFI